MFWKFFLKPIHTRSIPKLSSNIFTGRLTGIQFRRFQVIPRRSFSSALEPAKKPNTQPLSRLNDSLKSDKLQFPNTPYKYAEFGKAQNQQEFPPLDHRAFALLAKTAALWTFSFTLFLIMMGIMSYSWWWHKQREKARLQGLDLDKWLEDFEKTDPVVQFLKRNGLQK
jgi:hypothetical protein